MKRTVITGLGTVPSVSNDQRETPALLREGRSGITFSQELKNSGMHSHVWGNVKLDITDLIGHKVVCFTSDASIYTLLSMEQATADASPSPEVYQSNPRIGLIIDSGDGSPRFQVFGTDAMRGPHGLKAADPYMVTEAMAPNVSICFATPLKIHGVDYPVSSTYATSAHYIGNAIKQIQLGKQDIVFTGGGGELCWEMTYESDAMGALSAKCNDTPGRAPRAYDAHHDDFIIADDGGIMVVEELEHTPARGAHIYAGIVGYSAISDGADMVVPSGEGTVRYMKMAIYGVDTPINYLNSHGTPTPVDDARELAAIHEVFGGRSPTVSATKVVTGRSLGAVSIWEAIYSLLMLGHGFIAPSINIEELDRQTAGLSIVTETTDHELTIAMSNNFDFDGTNATLVTRKLKN